MFPVATRAGIVSVLIAADDITAEMPTPQVGAYSTAREHRTGREFAGTRVDVGNPHLVCPVDDVDALDLTAPPGYDRHSFPEGVNVEFVMPAEPVEGRDVHVRMRVYERGSGETLSCGSGACAVAAVALRDAGVEHGIAAVDLPGGRLTITLAGQRCALTGPAVIVATGDVVD
jgi:diaminopimelate epimerase